MTAAAIVISSLIACIFFTVAGFVAMAMGDFGMVLAALGAFFTSGLVIIIVFGIAGRVREGGR